MRAYQTIPRAIVCDNGTYFKGKLFTDFCQRLGIRLIHSVVHHPQTKSLRSCLVLFEITLVTGVKALWKDYLS